ncbi:hypothetical protein [Pseudoteredinibacter isoporae]|uniref:Putative membrane protein YphA (DoxX/SURF4 family) n=1 Tax=Pseudoteredinibacter isoporae TaxID=570281 RepID=A0A7X0JR42_9GAMM|nr:hypothetical protein [Pseudoteredinibacter isoporae]MBB6520768.1 putative membrane protein YphA (DoxX/SURF4 family) [Pseudoteredinibacter isoporae]NHO86334.1 hypothetical protein [Pseudoteredinibacter isoporae]NIB25214.1 hypothetical protein [Pseudoteredinibacter isoporae]
MKAWTLLCTRVSTGLLLLLWGAIKIGAPDKAKGVSEKYYGGLVSADEIVLLMGIGQIVVGLLVILGLFRKYAYPAQALILGFGLFAIWQYILDPLGMYLAADPKPLFFPSTTVFFATLIMLLYKEDDQLALDNKLGKS